jgi:hypothetical protein
MYRGSRQSRVIRVIKIPLNLPWLKGDFKFPHFGKGGQGGILRESDFQKDFKRIRLTMTLPWPSSLYILTHCIKLFPKIAEYKAPPAGRGFITQILNPRVRSRIKFGMTKKQEPNSLVMLNLFQHLVCFFLPSADTPFIPVHEMGFPGAILIKRLQT